MRIQIIGRGRMGSALERALSEAGIDVLPTLGRSDLEAVSPDGSGRIGAEADVVLLAVPDAAIGEVAARVASGRLVGHLSGLTPLASLGSHEGFGLHPLMTVTGAASTFAGAYAAVGGTTPEAIAEAERLAQLLGMTAFRVADEDRAAYHASASVASNFLMALEDVAERLAASAGVPRAALVPIAQAALRNWAELGAAEALTGPIARGDEETVARQREAVSERLPEALALFDALADSTRALAGRRADTAPHVEVDHEPDPGGIA